MKERFLTRGWGNGLSLGLGLVFMVYSIACLAASISSSLSGFIGLVVIGVLY